MRPDQQRVKQLLTEAVTLLCRNSLQYKEQVQVEGLIGITLDKRDILLVSIHECVQQNVHDQPLFHRPPRLSQQPVSPGRHKRRRLSQDDDYESEIAPVHKASSSRLPIEEKVKLHVKEQVHEPSPIKDVSLSRIPVATDDERSKASNPQVISPNTPADVKQEVKESANDNAEMSENEDNEETETTVPNVNEEHANHEDDAAEDSLPVTDNDTPQSPSNNIDNNINELSKKTPSPSHHQPSPTRQTSSPRRTSRSPHSPSPRRPSSSSDHAEPTRPSSSDHLVVRPSSSDRLADPSPGLSSVNIKEEAEDECFVIDSDEEEAEESGNIQGFSLNAQNWTGVPDNSFSYSDANIQDWSQFDLSNMNFPLAGPSSGENAMLEDGQRDFRGAYGATQQCPICKVHFKHMRKHFRAVHLGEKRYVCSFCDKRFSQKNNLTRHVATLHEALVSNITEQNSGLPETQEHDMERTGQWSADT